MERAVHLTQMLHFQSSTSNQFYHKQMPGSNLDIEDVRSISSSTMSRTDYVADLIVR